MSDVQTTVSTVNFDDVLAEFEESSKPDNQPDFTKPMSTSFDDVLKNPPPKTDVTDDKPLEQTKDVFDKILDKDQKDNTKDVPATNSVFSAIEELVKEGEIFLFSDKENLSDYTKEELVDLIKENKKHAVESVAEEQIKEVFEALPKDLQYAIQYAMNGGGDMKALYKALASTEEVRSLSLDSKKDQEEIINQYYSVLDWSSEEIEDEIKRLNDLGEEAVKKQAEKFKPKLDKMNEQIVQNKIAQQEAAREKQQQEMEAYFKNAAETIKKGTLGEVKIDKKTQSSLFNGLSQASYTSRKGTPTNELGHLLEKYQFVEPNFDKIYKALWLLKDEEGFFEAYGNLRENKATEKIARTLKTEMSKKDGNGTVDTDEEDNKKSKAKVLQRPVNFMAGLNK